jgi:hypothetical protein
MPSKQMTDKTMSITRRKIFRELNIHHQNIQLLFNEILSSKCNHEFSLAAEMKGRTVTPEVELQDTNTAFIPNVEMHGDNDIYVAIHCQITEALNSMLAAVLTLKSEAKQISWDITGIDFYQKLAQITDLMIQIKQAHQNSKNIASRALRDSLDEVVAELEDCFYLILERMIVGRINKQWFKF